MIEDMDAYIDDFLDTADRIRQSRHQERREALQRRLVKMSERMTAERDELLGKMESGWEWLESHKDDPRFLEFEDQWMAFAGRFNRICDALNEALHIWLDDEPAIAEAA